MARRFRVLEALDIPDPATEGTSTVLDNTILYWTNELGIGDTPRK